MPKQRSIGVAIILSLVTCGIYNIYWIYALTEDIAKLNEDHSFSGAKTLLLSLVTCGIYIFVWYYQLGSHIADIQRKNGMREKDDGILFIVLGLFSAGIVSSIIAQINVNAIITHKEKVIQDNEFSVE